MKFKNIIFDWSGVIKDALNAHVWVVNEMMERLGKKKLSFNELKENWEQPYLNFWRKYCPELTLAEEQKIYYEVIGSKDCPKSDSCLGVIDFIKKLNIKKVRMSVVSSDPTERLLQEIKGFGLENIFDEVITNAHDKSEGVNELIKKYDFNPEETVFIGDSNHEVEVGKEAGIKTIAVTWGFCTEEKLKSTDPDYLVHNIKELEEILL